MPKAPSVPGFDSPSVAPSSGASAPSGGGGNTVVVGNYNLSLQAGVNPTDTIATGKKVPIGSGGRMIGEGNQVTRAKPSAPTSQTDTVANVLKGFSGWSTTQYETFRNQAYQMGLTSSKTAAKTEVLVAWQTVVEEAAKDKLAPPELIKRAVAGGWNSLNPKIVPGDNGLAGTGNAGNNPNPSSSNSSSQTTYVSYMDPATAQGTLADAFQRLLGRNPTTKEYQAFLNSLYSYEDKENTGKFDNKTTESAPGNASTGAPGESNVQQNIVSQRQVSTRGAQFLAGQTAIGKPEEGAYQAATTYFNAFAKALAGPAAGMSASGPTNSAP